MPAPSPNTLELIQRAIGKYCDCDVPANEIVPDALLADLNLDSLSLADLLFAVEDALNRSIVDLSKRPKTVADLMVLIEPFEDELRSKIALD